MRTLIAGVMLSALLVPMAYAQTEPGQFVGLLPDG